MQQVTSLGRESSRASQPTADIVTRGHNSTGIFQGWPLHIDGVHMQV